MKLTILLGTFPWKPSGGAKVALEYANGLAAQGHEVEVLFARSLPNWTRPDQPPMRRRLKGALQRRLEQLGRTRLDWIELNPRVRTRSVAEYRPELLPDADFVVATFWPTAEVVAELPESKGRGVYLIQHLEDWAGPRERVEATWRLPLQKLFVARWLYRHALDLGLPPEQLTYLPNSIDSAAYRPRSRPDERGERVAMLYSETSWKGAAAGIAALEVLREERPDVTACLFGVWSRPADLPVWIEYRCRPKRAELIEEVYGEAAVFLCPSEVEGWGLPGAEAMAAGCALVTTANGGSGDYAEDGVTARVVEVGDVDSMARAMQDLLDRPEERVAQAHRGRARIEGFDFARSLGRLERILLRLQAEGEGQRAMSLGHGSRHEMPDPSVTA